MARRRRGELRERVMGAMIFGVSEYYDGGFLILTKNTKGD